MSPWVAAEMAGSQLDDTRHSKRLAQLLNELSARPANSIPSACHGWAETVAADRFWDNPPLGGEEILSGHKQAPLEWSRAREVALLVQDTSFLNSGPLPPKVGRGPGKAKEREEQLLHTPGGLIPERVNLGVVGAKLGQRSEEPVAHERARKPSEEKERDRWVEGSTLACEVQQACPQTVVVSVADCAGDSQEGFLEARNRPGEERAECLMRAKCNRRLAPGAAQEYGGEEMQATCPLGKRTFPLSRQADRPPRQVTLAVTARSGTFKGVRRPGGDCRPGTVGPSPPSNSSPPRVKNLLKGSY